MAANQGESVVPNGPVLSSIVAQAETWLTEDDRCTYHSVKVTKVYENRYRINFYYKHYPGENKVVPDFTIKNSFFAHYVDGILYDKTRYTPSPLND